MTIKVIIFDMDGVLIDAKEWHYDALNRALQLFGYSISRHQHLTSLDGLPTRAKLEVLSRDEGLPAGLHPIINRLKQQYTLDIVRQRCHPIFEHEYALSKLKADGYRLALASNSMRQTVEEMMTRSNLFPYFEILLSNEEVIRSKPDPEIYLEVFKRMKVQPSECLILEDNEHGIRAATAAGASVMVIGSIHDVTYDNIMKEIRSPRGVRIQV